MLNLFNLKLNNKNRIRHVNKDLTKSSQIKHFSPGIKEWNNSIYVYNKNTLNLIPVTNKWIITLIKNYLNMYNNKLELKVRRQRIRIKSRRLSSHKIFVSKGEFKHTNDRVMINIYIYNRQKYNYFYKLKKIYEKLLRKNLLFKRISRAIKKSYFLMNKIKNNKLSIINNNTWKNKYIYYNNIYIDKLLKKSVKRQMLYIYYKRLLLFNKLKFRYTYLNKIINLIKKIYNKNIELNIINLKYFYLNSDIYTEYVTNKITKNRKKLYKILKSSVRKVKIVDKKWMQNLGNINRTNKLSIYNYIKTKNIKSYLSIRTKKTDSLNKLLYKIFSKHKIKKIVINSIKNKTITGVRLETAGRLSKRHTASRSLFKLRYKGSLKNIDSTYKKLSSKMIRGTIKSNIQYTKLNSIARIGSFGVKGWISNN